MRSVLRGFGLAASFFFVRGGGLGIKRNYEGMPEDPLLRGTTMRLTKEQATENRQSIIDMAGRLFRESGFNGVSVADLMQAAGFTHGGFYNHFPSKETLTANAALASRSHSNSTLIQAIVC